MIDGREFLFLNSDDEVVVCKSLKELLSYLLQLSVVFTNQAIGIGWLSAWVV